MCKLVIDMMGSDLGSPITKAAVRHYKEVHPEDELILVGDESELTDMKDFEIVPTHDVVKMEMGALEVIRHPDSSLVRAVNLVKDRGFDGVVSAGSTGAFLSAATLLLKRIPGCQRPALVTDLPNLKAGGKITILDVGASNSNTPEEVAEFAIMGNLYSQYVNGIKNPRVALLSNGSEEGKGSPEGKEAFHLLKGTSKLNFIGNIEAGQILSGGADVVATSGYSGNVFLKGTEGAAKAIGGVVKNIFKKNLISKIAYLLVKGGVKDMKALLDPKKTGGALLLGVNGIVVKAHGNSNDEGFYNAMEVARKLSDANIVERIKEGLNDGK